tara:strand:- start:315 stop:476 length:162 start_codon:yes stop_codon:yes gene_type:complete
MVMITEIKKYIIFFAPAARKFTFLVYDQFDNNLGIVQASIKLHFSNGASAFYQ